MSAFIFHCVCDHDGILKTSQAHNQLNPAAPRENLSHYYSTKNALNCVVITKQFNII